MRFTRVGKLIEAMNTDLYEREEVVRLALLGALAGQNVFLCGPPGVGKSTVARRVCAAFADASFFGVLLGRFTTPDELFGPRSDSVERRTTGYLPDADIAYIEDIWSARTAVQSGLLAAMQERVFRNGGVEQPLHLKAVIGAAGGPPPVGVNAAFWDRFLLRLRVQEVAERTAFEAMIAEPASPVADPVPQELKITPQEYRDFQAGIAAVAVPDHILGLIYDVRERIARHNSHHRKAHQTLISVSDRRWKGIVHLLRTSAYLNDRQAVDALDAILMRHVLWSTEDQIEPVDDIVREALHNYCRSGRFDPYPLRERMTATLEEMHHATVQQTDVVEERAVLYRGEYLRLQDFVEDHLSLMWVADFQQLPTDRESEIDLFFYGENEEFAYSERFTARRVGEFGVEIAGELFSVETTTEPAVVERDVELDAEDSAAWKARLADLIDHINGVVTEIVSYRDRSVDAAVQHLFVHRRFAQVVTTGMNEAATEFSDLKLAVERALTRLQ